MRRYLTKRLLSLPPTLLGVSLLTFLFLRLIPGDAIAVRLGTATVLSPQQLAELRGYFGIVAVNTLVDVLYGYLDPRIRYE